MAIRQKNAALSKIRLARNTVKGKTYELYRVELGTHIGKRISISAPSLAECRRRVEDWYAAHESTGGASANLSVTQIAEATLAFDALAKAQVPVSLLTIVQEYIARCGCGIVKTKLTDAYDAYYAHFTDAQTMTRKCVQARVGAFVAKHTSENVSDIAMTDAQNYLASLGDCAPKTYNNHLCDLTTFFNWCAKKANRYCSSNPFADIEKRKLPSRPPECAEVDAVRSLFATIYNGNDRFRDTMLFRLALNYFGGVRVEEIKRMDTADVRIADGSVIVRDAKGTQTGKMSYRTFAIDKCGAALGAWLRVIDFGKVDGFDYGETAYNRAVLAAKAKCGKPFPKNAGRHSFISYHVAAFCNPQMTEGIVGTSEEMRKCNYQTLMTKADGDAYFSITPESVSGTSGTENAK